MSWSAVVAPVAVALLCVLLPGGALAVALRLRGLPALALAGPLGYGLIGVAGIAGGALHVRFDALLLAVVAFAAVALTVLVRLALTTAGVPLPAWGEWTPRSFLPVAGAIAVSSVAIGLLAFGAVPTPDRISQTYDAVFHLNAAASIVQGGDASSLHLYRLVSPAKSTAFYPAVWHSITALGVQLTGAPVPVAANATWIATAGPVFAPGCALAAQVLFGRTALLRREQPSSRQPVVIAVAAGLAAGVFPAFPYLLLDFGTLYPNGLADTMLPSGLALVAALTRWPEDAPWRPEHPLPGWRTALLVVLWFGAAALTHPRSLVALVVLVVPLLVAWSASRIGHLARSGERGRRAARRIVAGAAAGVVVLAAVGAFGLYRGYDLAHRPIADHLNGGPALAVESFPRALVQGLLGTTLASPSHVDVPVAPIVAAALLAALTAAIVRRGLRWAAVTVLLVVVLWAAAAGSDSDLAKLATGLWDKDKFRIIAMLPTIAAPLVAWLLVAGSTELVTVLRRRRQQRADPRPATVLVAAAVGILVVVAGGWLGPSLSGMRSAIGVVFSLPSGDKHGLLVDSQQQALLERVGSHVPQGQVIADDPWDGGALALALGGADVLFPHLGGDWGPTRNLIAKHLDAWRRDPAVCAAVRSLDVHWILTDDQRFHSRDSFAGAFTGIAAAARAGAGVQLVDSDGGASLYRFTGCWGTAP